MHRTGQTGQPGEREFAAQFSIRRFGQYYYRYHRMELCRNIFKKFYSRFFKKIKTEFKHHLKPAKKLTMHTKNKSRKKLPPNNPTGKNL